MKKWGIFLLLIIFSILSLFVGVHKVSIHGLLDGNEMQWLLFWKTRFPRTITLILAGAMISVSGKMMQHLMNNRFISPNAIGMMDSAKIGILFVMLLMPSSSLFIRSVIAFLFAYVGVLIFLFIAKFLPQKDPFILPLTGMMFSNMLSAIAAFIAYRFQVVQNVGSWLQGDFTSIISGNYELIYITVPVFMILYFFTYQITVAGLGEENAKSLGLNVKRLQLFIFALVALGSSAVLLMVGSIPFLGIVIPNLIGLYYSDHLKNTLPIIALSGSLFIVICDILARTIVTPYEIPVSLIIGIIGGGLFIYILVRRRQL